MICEIQFFKLFGLNMQSGEKKKEKAHDFGTDGQAISESGVWPHFQKIHGRPPASI